MTDTRSINSSDCPVTSHSTLDVGTTSTQMSGSTCATCNRILQNLYRLHIFNKLEVSRLDSRLSSFIIISSYICTLSRCQRVVRSSRNWEHLTVIQTHHLVRIQITFKTIQTPATKEFEQGNLNVKRTILQ